MTQPPILSMFDTLSCVHTGCAGERFEMPLSAVLGINRRTPMPGLAPVLAELRQELPIHHDVSFCTGCGCLFPVAYGHGH